MASITPRHASENTHGARMYHGLMTPPGFASETESMSIAGTADTIVFPVAYPADEAVDCIQLFSRIVIGAFQIPSFWNPVEMAYDRMHAVRATPKNQPVLRPT